MKLIKRFLELNPHTLRSYKVTRSKATIQTVFDEVIDIRKEKDYYNIDITTTIKGFHDIQTYRLDKIDVFKLLYDCVFNFYRGVDIIYDYMENKSVNANNGDD